MARDQAGWAVGHQRRQAVLADQLVKNVDAFFVEMWWYVHGRLRKTMMAEMAATDENARDERDAALRAQLREVAGLGGRACQLRQRDRRPAGEAARRQAGGPAVFDLAARRAPAARAIRHPRFLRERRTTRSARFPTTTGRRRTSRRQRRRGTRASPACGRDREALADLASDPSSICSRKSRTDPGRPTCASSSSSPITPPTTSAKSSRSAGCSAPGRPPDGSREGSPGPRRDLGR